MRVYRLRPGRALLLVLVLASASLGAADSSERPSADQAAPQGSATALPSARQVIDRHVKAVGGRAAILAHTSTRMVGSVSLPSAGMSGTLEAFAAKPDKAVLRLSLAGVGEVQEGFDGRIGWSMSPMTGPALADGKELEQRKFDADYYAELRPDVRYESMTTVEKTMFEGRTCYKLRLIRKGGGEDLEFYDVETGLKAGGITTRETPMGSVTATSVEADYQRFGKLLQATTITQTLMGVQQVIKISTVEFDKVDPAVFEPPAAIKALLK
jgi:hypothetical protein